MFYGLFFIFKSMVMVILPFGTRSGQVRSKSGHLTLARVVVWANFAMVGGGSKWPPHVTQKLIGLGRHAIRRSIALNNVFQKYIGYFFLRSIFRSPEVRRGQLLLRTVVFFGILAIISETIIDRAKPKKANDSSEEALSPISYQNWAKSHSFGCISQKFQK